MLIEFDGLFARHGLRFSGVLHCGANVGEEAPVYDRLGIRKQIWIEANPDVFLELKANISKYPDAVALNVCVGNENKDTVLHVSNNHSQSSSVLELGTHAQAHPEVHYVRDIPMKMQRIDSLGLDLTGVDLLNLDLQGFELQALQGMGSLINQFKAVYMEVNTDELYRGCAKLDSIDLFMLANRFTRVETMMTKWNWGDALYIRK